MATARPHHVDRGDAVEERASGRPPALGLSELREMGRGSEEIDLASSLSSALLDRRRGTGTPGRSTTACVRGLEIERRPGGRRKARHEGCAQGRTTHLR